MLGRSITFTEPQVVGSISPELMNPAGMITTDDDLEFFSGRLPINLTDAQRRLDEGYHSELGSGLFAEYKRRRDQIALAIANVAPEEAEVPDIARFALRNNVYPPVNPADPVLDEYGFHDDASTHFMVNNGVMRPRFLVGTVGLRKLAKALGYDWQTVLLKSRFNPKNKHIFKDYPPERMGFNVAERIARKLDLDIVAPQTKAGDVLLMEAGTFTPHFVEPNLTGGSVQRVSGLLVL